MCVTNVSESEPPPPTPPKKIQRVNMWSDVVRDEIQNFTVANKASGMLENAVDVQLHRNCGQLINAWRKTRRNKSIKILQQAFKF